MQIYNTLLEHFGRQHWWPADTRFEVIVGAILTQQTSWRNVEKAIDNLKEAGMLDTGAIADADLDHLEELIRPSGYFKQKSIRLKGVCQHLKDEWAADLDEFFNRGLDDIRTELLSLHGIGKETADSILNYAGDKMIFVVDAYTVRLSSRLPIKAIESAKYDDVQDFFHSNLPQDLYVYQEFHALIVKLCVDCCRSGPRCDICPLKTACSFFLGGLDPAQLS